MDAAVCIDDYFEIRSMNDWVRPVKVTPVPKMLFGEFWHEGEVAILFGDTGCGKTVLATQIAESIARGRNAFDPGAKFPAWIGGVAAASADGVVDLTESDSCRTDHPVRETRTPLLTQEGSLRPKTVLNLDFELSEKQIEMRYSADFDPEKGEYLKNHYDFSRRFKRIILKTEVFREKDGRPFESMVRDLIEPLVARTKAKVLIIDNITYLKRRGDNSYESAPLMKALKAIRNKFDLSILLIAHPLKRNPLRPIVLNDMQGSKVIANHADSIFAIGQSTGASNERYIKQIKARSGEVIYGSNHLPVFRLAKLGGNFLGFELTSFAPESKLLSHSPENNAWRTIQTVKDLSDSGMPVRQIAAELGISKSSAHRYLQMWQQSSPSYEGGVAAAAPLLPEEGWPRASEAGVVGADGVVLSQPVIPTLDNDWQQREEEYSGEFTDIYLTSAGMRPVFKEKLEAMQHESVPRAVATGILESPISKEAETTKSHEATRKENDDSLVPHFEKPGEYLTRALDAYDKEIFIESYESGKPKVWYQYRSDGVLQRWARNGCGGVIGTTVVEGVKQLHP